MDRLYLTRYCVGCCRGLETYTAREITSLGAKVVRVEQGLVVADATPEVSQLLPGLCRTAEWIAPLEEVGFRRTSVGLGEADKEWAPFSMASDLMHTKESPRLWQRKYRKFNHPSAIRPSTAASLLLMTRMDTNLVDPFVGGGTFLVEDALYKRQAEKYSGLGIGPHKSLGVEINPKHLSGALKNTRAAGVQDDVSLVLGDSTRFVPDHPFPRLVTNPPFGVRGRKKERILLLYERFVQNLDRILSEPGEGVIITTEWKEMSRYLIERGYVILQTVRITHGKLLAGVISFRA